MTRPVFPLDEIAAGGGGIRQSGFSLTFPDGTVAARPERGRAKVRRLTSAPVGEARLTIRTDRDGLARIRKFHARDTGGGVIPFFLRDPLFDGTPLAEPDGDPLLTPDGEPLLQSAWLICQFVSGEAPQAPEVKGVRILVSFPVYVLP